MSTILSSLRRYISTASMTALLLCPAAGQVMAAPGALSQVPLYVGPSVEPNVVFVSDDSGSMEWTMMTPESEGIMWVNNGFSLDYHHTHPAPTHTWWVIATEEYLMKEQGLAYPAGGVWRARNHNYNKTYYNPAITYEPWVGVDEDGNAYGDMNPSAALADPYDPDRGTVNLTNPNSSYATDYPNIGGFNVTNFYPARYYIWTDSDADGVVDAADAHTLVEITNVATAMTDTPAATYTGGPNRTDCAAAPVCSYAEEIQNFANWFSYHRSREHTTKNAATSAISEITGVRVGYATINNNNDVRIGVESMNLESDSGNKRDLFDKIYESRSVSGTPLRRALRNTGRYFECVSNNIMDASGSECPILPASQGGMCQKNFTILMTDGFWNGSSPSLSPSDTDTDGNTEYDGGSYADGYTNTLADVAMHYYERDLATGLTDEVPFSSDDKDNAPHQHMTTYTVAFGVNGTLNSETDDPKDNGFSWPNAYNGNAEKIDDLWHAAYNGRGEFYNANDPVALQDGLASAFASVSRGKSSSASVAFNTTKLGTDSRIYQASFNPSDNWSGALVATELSISGQLEGEAWNAADLLDNMDPNNRVILTYNEASGEGIPFRNIGDLSTRQSDDLNTSPSGATDSLGQDRLDYLRGDRSNEGPGQGHEFRERTTLLGDIVYSNPVYVGRPELGYEDEPSFGDGMYSNFREANIDREPVVYVGSNDGMLHGFSAASGTEVVSYVPNKLFSDGDEEGLHYLTDPDYEHRYYVDLSPTVSDVFIGGGWKTVLIGGYRAGGRGLFALDVTQPSTFSEDNADDTVLWEFTNDDSNNLGHTFSKPTMALMENDQWAAIFGNGYNDLGDGQAKLYILFIDQGIDGTWSGGDFVEISTDVGSTGDRNGLSTPVLVDSDGNGKADRVYAGDLMGNLWAFDTSSSNSGSWDVAFAQGGTVKPLFNASISGVAQPITSKPVVARNPAQITDNNNRPNILVFFGTGQYLVNGDKSTTGTQTFYGVWDDDPNANQLPHDRADLVAQTLDTSKSTTELRVTSDNVVDYASTYGWHFDLPTSGERVVVDPRVRGEFVFFNTLIPDPMTCNTKGNGWLMALRLVNGATPENPVFDVNNDGEVNDDDLLDGSSLSGVRLDGIPAGSNFLDDVMYTPDDEGNIDIRRIDAGISIQAGRLSWRELRQ